jgi:hypothetical protein
VTPADHGALLVDLGESDEHERLGVERANRGPERAGDEEPGSASALKASVESSGGKERACIRRQAGSGHPGEV